MCIEVDRVFKELSQNATIYESAKIVVDNELVWLKTPQDCSSQQKKHIEKILQLKDSSLENSLFVSLYNLSHFNNNKFDFWICFNREEDFNSNFRTKKSSNCDAFHCMPLCSIYCNFYDEKKTLLLEEKTDDKEKMKFELRFRNTFEYKNFSFSILRAIAFIEHHSSSSISLYEICK